MLRDMDLTVKQWQSGLIEIEKHQFDEGALDNDDELEDMTEILFKCTEELKDDEIVSKEEFDLADTMNGFELMDPKMDCKAALDQWFSIQRSKESGVLKEEWTNEEVLSILNHFLVEEARWMKGNSAVSSIYSCQILTDPVFYCSNKILNAYVEYLLYFEYNIVELFRMSGSVREDEFAFPPTHEPNYTFERFDQLIAHLEEVILEWQKMEEGDISKSIWLHLKFRLNLIKSYMLIMYDEEILKPKEEEKVEEVKQKSKGKKKKNKSKKKSAVQFDRWKEVSSILSECTTSFLPALSSSQSHVSEKVANNTKKLFDPTLMKTINMVITLSNNNQGIKFEDALQLFRKLWDDLAGIKEIRVLMYVYQLKEFIKNMHKNNPWAVVRALLERTIFPDPMQVKIFEKFDMPSEYLREFVTSLFPNIWTHFDTKAFKDFMYKFSLMTRETLLKYLKNTANQTKQLNRHYEDLSILISEANFIDDFLINK
jgi:hypothetical protein